jgi:hypothetical protein
LPQLGQPFFDFDYIFWCSSDFKAIEHRNPELLSNYLARSTEVLTEVGVSPRDYRFDVFPVIRIVQVFDYLLWNS